MSKELSEAVNEIEQEWTSHQRPLTERISGGDSEAIVEFVMQYQRRVRSVAMDVLKDADLAVIATRDTFRSAITQLQNGVETRQEEPWLLWIARNEALALTQVASQKRNGSAEKKTEENKPIPIEAEKPAAEAATVARSGAAGAAEEAKTSVDYRAAIDARILSLLGRETPRKMEQDTQKTVPAAVIPNMAEAHDAQTAKPIPITEAAEPSRRVDTEPKERYEKPSVEEPPYTEEPIQSVVVNRAPAQDDALLRIENRERKRAQGLQTEAPVPDKPATADPQNEALSEKPKATVGDVLLTVGMAAVALLLIWIVLGLLSKNGVLNLPDLGFDWFNENVFYLF